MYIYSIMPSLNNTIHSNTIAGQIYNRGVNTGPLNIQRGFVGITMNSFPMLRRIGRFNTRHGLKREIYLL